MHPCDHLAHCLAQLLDFPAVLLVQRGVRLGHLGQAFIKLLVAKIPLGFASWPWA